MFFSICCCGRAQRVLSQEHVTFLLGLLKITKILHCIPL